MIDGKKHVGIGFATGRTCFLHVLLAYIFHLQESNFLNENRILLSLYVAYDPSYRNTTREDYDRLGEDERSLFYACRYIGPEDIQAQAQQLTEEGIIPQEQRDTCFGTGYAKQRNIILYQALKDRVDDMIFLDDDEYPLAVTRTGDTSLWSGQLVLEEHIKYLQFSDVTNGYHCGYISPLPSFEFDGILDESTFHQFTDALSSDILQWPAVCRTMQSGGVNYADKQVLIEHQAKLVEPFHGAKIVTGGNLGINLTQPQRVLPFYNPPGARGEDSIFSACLSDYTVKSIPVYTFHDGFGFYGSLLRGVLPTQLKKISFYDSAAVIERFYRACIGWIRYKPLFTYLTQPMEFEQIMKTTRENLMEALPKVCAYFNRRDFGNILEELDTYVRDVPKHHAELLETISRWKRIVEKTILQ